MTPTFAKTPEMPVTGCFARDYSDQHLQNHPDQVVDQIIMQITETPLEQGGDTVFGRSARLSVLTANQGHAKAQGKGAQRFDQWLFCGNNKDDGPFCTVECDGGYMIFSTNTQDRIVFRTKYLWVGEREGEEGCAGAIDIGENADQFTVYRLDRVKQATCDTAFPKE